MFEIRSQHNGEKAMLELIGDVTVEHAEEIRDFLLENLPRYRILQLDFSQVEQIDFFVLQLLCAAHRSMIAENKTLTWVGELSPPVRDAIRLNGFLRTSVCGVYPEDVCCLWS